MRARRVLLSVAMVVITAGSCSSDDGVRKEADKFIEAYNRSELEQAIEARLADLIQDQQLTYVVADQPSFSETTEERVAGTGLPNGTWLSLAFEFPPKPDAEHPPSKELVLYGPIKLYADAVRPFIDQMDFVVMYFLGWEDSGGNAFLIYPEHMRQYLDGSISAKQLSEKMSIYGPP
jgi:hypothetical protein